LTLVSFSSVVGYNSVKNIQEEIITDEWDFEYCKDFLFETIVEISNNEDVNDLTNSNNQNLFPTNSNHRNLFPFRRNTNKISLSVEHLDLLYNMGLRIIDRLGEEKVAEIMETRSIDKSEFADEFDTIIMGNGDLKDRIYTLNEMNAKSDTLEQGSNPIICVLISIIFLPVMLIAEILDQIIGIIGYTFLFLAGFVAVILVVYWNIFVVPYIVLDDIFDCGIFPILIIYI